MFDLIIRRLDEDGSPRPGWHRCRPHDAVRQREHLVSAGMNALAALPQSSPRRADVLAWTKRAGDDGTLPAGTYTLGRGKAALVIEPANAVTMADARARSEIAAADTRILPKPEARGRVTTVDEAQRVLRQYGRR